MKTLVILLTAAALAACAKPAAAPKPATAAAPHAPIGSNQSIQGKVAERLDAGGFTYLRIETAAGDRWLVTSPVEVKVGEKVSASSGMVVEKFESKSLNRTFDNIIFGTIDGAKPSAAHASAPSPMADVGDVKVDKAGGADAKTVAEVWASRAALKDKQVVVRGKIVKFLPSIMGKNWMHVRDGSGSRGKGDDDIAVISDDTATVGSVVTLTGTVRIDKDFGAGYQYPVIIDGAKLK